jgi:oleandomycin transport system ATP-binding protein
VGGQRLTVRPNDPARLADVHSILAAVARREPEDVGHDALSVAVSGDDALTAAVARLHEAGIAVTELSLHLPSLDEVFFTITGERTHSDEKEAS